MTSRSDNGDDRVLKVRERSRWDIMFCDDDYLSGMVYTKHGIVEVFSDANGNDEYAGPWTCLFFVLNGIEYQRRWNKCFGKKHLATLAKRFANDVISWLR